jgi:hypothetical protein
LFVFAVIVFSTCSVAVEGNEDVVGKWRENHSFVLCKRVSRSGNSPWRVCMHACARVYVFQPALFPVAPLAGAAATEIVPLPHYAPIPCLYEFQTTAISSLFCIVGRRRVVTRDAAKRPSGPLRVCADTTFSFSRLHARKLITIL